jgi:carbamoyltransferase
MIIIGISAYFHDSACALIIDGKIIAAAQEERFTRKKNDSSFPIESLNFCLRYGNLDVKDVDFFVFYEKPLQKFDRILETYLGVAPQGFRNFYTSAPIWIKDKLFLKNIIEREIKALSGEKLDLKNKIMFSGHHLSHAASAFFASPFQDAAVLTIDAVGEWDTSSIGLGHGSNLELLETTRFPHSLGLLYSSFTSFLGFRVNSAEYKVMGLAPYGIPKYVSLIKENIVQVNDDGSIFLNMEYFDFLRVLKMESSKFSELFETSARNPEELLTQKDMDIAASLQIVTEEIVVNKALYAKRLTGMNNLCMAGGVALNCVANGNLLKRKEFKNIWVQPAAGDAGGSIGAALAFYFLALKNNRDKVKGDLMKNSYLGPAYTTPQVEASLNKFNLNYSKPSHSIKIESVVNALISGQVVGWFSGQMEFGPRSLGARSILADPRSTSMQSKLNLSIKFRESFRPFAPSVLEECAQEWFDLEQPSPYMMFTAEIKGKHRIAEPEDYETYTGIDKLKIPRSTVPAITHIDYSARVQTVNERDNPKFYELISEFYKITGVPTLINTSFNVRGEPIVNTPEDAINCFLATDMDLLCIEDFLVFKSENVLVETREIRSFDKD